jgi:hypothetical protein
MDRYILTITKDDEVSELTFKTFQQIADHLKTSLNTARQIYAFSQGEITKPRKSIRTKHFYDMYSINEIIN